MNLTGLKNKAKQIGRTLQKEYNKPLEERDFRRIRKLEQSRTKVFDKIEKEREKQEKAKRVLK